MKTLIITLPAYNESLVVERSVRAVHDWAGRRLAAWDWQIVVADNGSTDGTADIAERVGRELGRVSVFHTREKGRGQALRRLWLAREADFYVYMDIDLAAGLDSFFGIIKALDGGAPVVIGSRHIAGARVWRSLWRGLLSHGYNWIACLLLPLGVRDAQCGAKGVSREAVRSVVARTEEPGWFFDTELIACARQAGWPVVEAPMDWQETRFVGRKSKVRLLHTALDGLRHLWQLRGRLR